MTPAKIDVVSMEAYRIVVGGEDQLRHASWCIALSALESQHLTAFSSGHKWPGYFGMVWPHTIYIYAMKINRGMSSRGATARTRTGFMATGYHDTVIQTALDVLSLSKSFALASGSKMIARSLHASSGSGRIESGA